MPKSKTKKASGRLELEQQKLANQALQDDLKLRKQAFANIEPFAKAMIALGLDPASILSTPLGVSLLMPGRTAIGQEFEAARSQLVDLLGSRGFSTGSGVGVGPLANLFGQEAQQQSQLTAGLPLQAVQLGLQGANLLQGQQAIFNPQITGGIASQSAANVIGQPEGPGVQIATAAAGGLGQALSGFGQPRPAPVPKPVTT
jgi:hypothetical protein